MGKIYVLGNLNVDIIMGYFEKWPSIGSEVTGDFFDFRYAGAAGNSALALKKLGFDVYVISSIGSDEFGERFFSKFEEEGINLSKCEKSKKRTGMSVGISFENKERTFFTFLGALEDMDETFINQKVKEIEDSWIIICGFNLIPFFQDKRFLETIKRMKERKNKILFDPGWPPEGWDDGKRQQAVQLATLSDWFVPNLSEAQAISQKSSLKESIEYFKKQGIRNCVIKLGKNGSQGFTSDSYTLSAVFQVGEIKDTVGAGDLFNAALIKGITLGWDNKMAIKFATFYASLCITKIGKERYLSFEEAYTSFLKEV